MPAPPSITDAEWRVMRVVWSRGEVTTPEIIAALEHASDWQPETIRTLLSRLVKKGALGYEKKGRAFLYTARYAESVCARAEATSLLQRCYRGAVQPMLAEFIGQHDLSDAEIQELKQLLDEKREARES